MTDAAGGKARVALLTNGSRFGCCKYAGNNPTNHNKNQQQAGYGIDKLFGNFLNWYPCCNRVFVFDGKKGPGHNFLEQILLPLPEGREALLHDPLQSNCAKDHFKRDI